MAHTAAVKSELQELIKELHAKRARYVELTRSGGPERVEDHVLQGPDGDAPLSSFFGEHDDLIVIHNMGTSCPYCTLWADGLNGVLPHLENRAAFVLVSPDTPEQQRAFAESRGWGFRMASNADSGFTKAMGYSSEDGGKTYMHPGYSTFRRNEDGTIDRIAHDMFGPGDHYCQVWHMFPLLADGTNDWQPKFTYP